MLNIFKKSKLKLAKDIFDVTVGQAESFYKFIKLDKEIYEACYNDATIQLNTLFYLLAFFYDKMLEQYNVEDTFKVIYTVVTSSVKLDASSDEIFKRFMAMVKERDKVIESEKENYKKDEYEVLTNILFSFVIEDKDVLLENLKA